MTDKRLPSALLSNYVGKYGQQLIALFFSIYFVGELSQDDSGEWNLYLNTFRFLVAFSALGFPSLIQRFIPEFVSSNR